MGSDRTFLWGEVEPQARAQAGHWRVLVALLALGPGATYLLSALVSPRCMGKTHSSPFPGLHGCQAVSQSACLSSRVGA